MAQYQITQSFEKKTTLLKIIQSMLFVVPHTAVRVISFSLVAAFFKFYAIVPALVLLVTNTIIARAVAKRNKGDEGNGYLFITLLAGLCAPFCFETHFLSHQRYLRRSLLTTNLLLLIGLLFLFFFPSMVPPCFIPQHVYFESNATVAIDKMALSHEKFSGQFFFPLLILTIFVTSESVLLQFEDKNGKTRLPTPYRWFDVHDYER